MTGFLRLLTTIFLFFYFNLSLAVPTGSDILSKPGQYKGTTNGALFLRYGPNLGQFVILDFQGSKAELETDGSNYRMRFYTTSGKTHGWFGNNGLGLALIKGDYTNANASGGLVVHSIRKEKGWEYWTLRFDKALWLSSKAGDAEIQTDSSLVLALKTAKTGEPTAALSKVTSNTTAVNAPLETDIIYQIQVDISSLPLNPADYQKVSHLGKLSTEFSGIQFDDGMHRILLGSYMGRSTASLILAEVIRAGYDSARILQDGYTLTQGNGRALKHTIQLGAYQALPDASRFDTLKDIYIKYEDEFYKVFHGLYSDAALQETRGDVMAKLRAAGFKPLVKQFRN